MIYSRKGYLVKASSKKQAINKMLLKPFEDKLVDNRDLLAKYFNVSEGSNDSILKIKLANYNECNNLIKRLYDKGIIKKIELESNVTFNYKIIGNVIHAWFSGEKTYLKSGDKCFTLSNFLYLAKDNKTSLEFISKYGLNEDDTTIGSDSIQALVKLCIFLQSYKSRLFIDMIEP